MGRQRRLKQQRRNNERIEAESEIFPIIEFMLNEEFIFNEDMNMDQPEDFMDAVLKRLMPMLPSFSGKNFELWAIKMEKLLDSVDLWKFVQKIDMNSENKCKRAIALFLIISTLDESILSSILNEFGEVFDPKMFWHILEIKYSMKGSEKDEIDEIVVQNSDCVESIITEIKTESMSLDDNKVTCDSPETPCDAKTCEVKYDENYVSHEEWLCLMHEKQLIDELLFGKKICLSSYTNQMQDDTTIELVKEVEIMNQTIMKDDNLQNDVDIVENKIVEDSKADEEDYIIGHDSKYNGEFVKLECILYKALSHGKRGKHELDYLGDVALYPNLEEVADIKYANQEQFKEVISKSRKEKLHNYLMARKVKMKLRLKINKYGPFKKKTKMKALFFCIFVSLAET